MRSLFPILACLFFLTLLPAYPAFAEESTRFSVPNSGSPYLNLGEAKSGQIVHLPTGEPVNVEQMIESISGDRVIYIGETHDNIEAHKAQLEVIQRLHQRYPGKIAVGMEMFRRSAQPDLNLWNQGQFSRKKFRKLFRQNWGNGFALYRPIFNFMESNKIPLFALKSTHDMEQTLRDQGPGQPGLPELNFDDPYHRAYSLSLFGANPDHADQVSKPYQMLVLWEESMAESVANFLNNPKYRDFKLVVLAGGFHVQYGYGIPKRAFRRVPHGYSIILPTVIEMPEELKDREMNVGPVSIPLYSADFAWVMDYRVPPEKKIRLGVQLKETETEGLLVTAAMPGSTADRLGMKAEDRVIELNGETVLDFEDLSDKLQKQEYGQTITVLVQRQGRNLSLSGTLKAPPPHQH